MKSERQYYINKLNNTGIYPVHIKNRMAKQSQQLVLMLVIGVLIGTAGVMAWKTQNASEELETAISTTGNGATTSAETIIASQETITHAPQLPLAPSIPKGSRVGINVQDQLAGNSVNVEGLRLEETKWIAVYDERDDEPGYIMGAIRARAGDTNVSVELLRPTIKGEKYFVGILNDDGNDAFNRQTDLPPLSPDKVVIVSFVAQ